MYSYLGMAMVLISWVAGAYLLTKWRGSRAMSISQHAASADTATRLFAATLLVCGTIFYAWLATCSRPNSGWVYYSLP